MSARSPVNEDSTAPLLARIRNPNTGDHPTLAETSSVSVTVYNLTAAALIRTYSPSKADVLRDTLVSDDPRWPEDDEGWNVIVMATPTDTANVGDVTVTLTITPTSGTAYSTVWEMQVRPTNAD